MKKFTEAERAELKKLGTDPLPRDMPREEKLQHYGLKINFLAGTGEVTPPEWPGDPRRRK